MPHLSAGRGSLLAAAASVAFTASASAQGTSATPAPNTITVTGTGQVRPSPANARSNRSIAEAVRRARTAATPLALQDGRARAARLAQLSGLTLGPLLAIAEASPSPFGPFGPFGQEGTFGPGRFCGTIRTSRLVRTKAGQRRRVFRFRRACRVPLEVVERLTMTFGSSTG